MFGSVFHNIAEKTSKHEALNLFFNWLSDQIKIKKEMSKKRNVTRIIENLRYFLLGRKLKENNRGSEDMTPKTQPLPNLPSGPYNQLAGNYYYDRDARREVFQPTSISKWNLEDTKPIQQQISEITETSFLKLPGPVHQWDKIKCEKNKKYKRKQCKQK